MDLHRGTGAAAGRAIAKGAVGAVALLASAQPVRAQESEVSILRQQIADMQARLDKLEASQHTATEATKSSRAVTAKMPVTISGLLQVNTRQFGSQSGPGAINNDTLQLRRGEIKLTGTITSRLTGSIMFDPTKALAATAAPAVVGVAPAITVNQATTAMQELQLSYLLHKSPTTSNSIDLGQYKIPIGYEGDLVSSSALQTVDRSLMYVARDPFGGGNGDIRDTGVRLRGTSGPFDYDLGLFQGFGERQNALSTGDTKPVMARLIYHPGSLAAWQFGISGGTGASQNFPAAGSKVKRNLTNLFAVYKKNAVTFQSEYLTGKNQAVGAAPTVARNITGYYASVGYKFKPKWEGVARYDTFDFDSKLTPKAGVSSATKVKEATLGLNYYIKGNNAKIQANLVRRQGAAGLIGANGFGGNATAFSKSSTQLRTNFQVAF